MIRVHKPAKLAALTIALAITCPSIASAGRWDVLDEESVSLAYRNNDESEMEIGCDSKSTVTVSVPPGIPRPTATPFLTYGLPSQPKTIGMDVEVCGGETTCTDRNDGEVSTYFFHGDDKATALDIAASLGSVAITAPGINLDLKADAAAFKKFADMCKAWK